MILKLQVGQAICFPTCILLTLCPTFFTFFKISIFFKNLSYIQFTFFKSPKMILQLFKNVTRNPIGNANVALFLGRYCSTLGGGHRPQVPHTHSSAGPAYLTYRVVQVQLEFKEVLYYINELTKFPTTHEA